jgi:hypothetical protein
MHVAVVSRGDYWTEFRKSLLYQLQISGFRATLHEYIDREVLSADVVFVIGIHEHQSAWRIAGKILIGIQTEQLPIDRSEKSIGRMKVNDIVARAMLPCYDLIIEWSSELYHHYYKSDGVRFIPFGFSGAGTPPDSLPEKRYDILFIGKKDGYQGRRQKILDAISREFRVHPAPDNLWGDARETAIRESAICLNLHYDPLEHFESPRIYSYIENGGFIISEPMRNSFPFVEGHDYVTFRTVDELLLLSREYLGDSIRRATIASNAHATALRYRHEVTIPLVVNEIRRVVAMPKPRLKSFLAKLSQRHLYFRKSREFAARIWRSVRNKNHKVP